MNHRALRLDEKARLHELMPWYLNKTIGEADRQWVDAVLAESDEARGLLLVEQAIDRSVGAMLAPAPMDIGLDKLMAKVRQEQVQSVSRAAQPSLLQQVTSWLSWLTSPKMAYAMSVLVVFQLGVIGWMSQSDQEERSAYRSVGVTELRTVRVTFKDQVTEKDIQTALISVSGRIVGGPTVLGEYWIASNSLSTDEIMAGLKKSGIVSSVVEDRAGPRGH